MKQETREVIERIHRYFKDRGLTLSAAESCTGGLISHSITSLAGASEFFRAGIVAYSEDIKKSVLGLERETIETHGVVSEATAREMAEKVCLLAKTDYAVSTTGNIGPDGLEGKAAGLIYIAACTQGKTVVKELRLTGDRETNKEQASFEALTLLIELARREEKNT